MEVPEKGSICPRRQCVRKTGRVKRDVLFNRVLIRLQSRLYKIGMKSVS